MSLFVMKLANAFSSRELSNSESLLKNSIRKLSSGNRLVKSRDDTGMLSMQMKMNADSYRITSAMGKIGNAVSFLDMQDGMLSNAQNILTRMAELKALSTNDPMKSEQDIDSYNQEFQELQIQLHHLSKEKFNGTSLFATTTQTVGGNEVKFRGNENEDHTFNISVLNESITVSIQKLGFIDSLKIINPEPSVEEDHTVQLNPTTDLEMIRVKPGTFSRWGKDVSISKEFYLGKYEVTQEQWKVVMTGNDKGISLNPSPTSNHSSTNPVERVKLDDVQVFIDRLNEQQADNLPDGWEYDLPDELEWEYAARAGTVTAYSWGDTIDKTKANYNWDGGMYDGIDHNRVVNVGQYDPNPWGLYDMHGNALEWTDTVRLGKFILGSGAFYSEPNQITSSSRYVAPSSSRTYLATGFRLALKKKSIDTPALNSTDRITVANEERKDVLKLSQLQSSYFDKAIENISYLRSASSATSSRLNLTQDLCQQVNFSSNNAFSKIFDVDYAMENSKLAKQKILSSSSAAMIAQANSMGDVLLTMLN